MRDQEKESNQPSKPPRQVRSALAETIGRQILALRSGRSWSQRTLAARVGIDSTKLDKYEKGEHLPPHLILVQMADVFGVPVDHLMGRSPEAAPEPGGELAKRLRQVEKLGPQEREAAAGMLDMLLGLHGIVSKRRSGTAGASGRGAREHDGQLARLFGEVAELEKQYRDVAAAVLAMVLKLLRYVRDPGAGAR